MLPFELGFFILIGFVRARIFLIALFGKNFNVDYYAFHRGGRVERFIYHMSRLLAKNCAQKPLLWGRLNLAFRSYLAY